MSMFACIVFCVVAVNSSIFCVHADKPTLREILKPFLEACTKEYPAVTTDAINKATEVGDPYLIHHCFNGCVFKKAGFLNDKGEYDANSALINLREIVTDDEQYTTLAEVARECLSGIYLKTGRYFMSSDTGVWKMCRYVFQPHNKTVLLKPPMNITGLKGDYLTKCTNYLAPPVMEPLDLAYDIDIANYVRTMISFGIISLFVMAMGCGFSMYTFHNPRYMFKRLAAGIHFISTSCTFVVVQVMMSSLDHMKKNVIIYPEKAYHYYNISFFLAWFVVLVNLFAAASFLWYSRKRKGDKAATDELAMADEPTIIGR